MEVDEEEIDQSPAALRDRALELKWLEIRDYLRVENLARAAKSCKALRGLALHPSTRQIVTSSLILPCAARRLGACDILWAMGTIYLPSIKNMTVDVRSRQAHATFMMFTALLLNCSSLEKLSLTFGRHVQLMDLDLSRGAEVARAEDSRQANLIISALGNIFIKNQNLTDLCVTVERPRSRVHGEFINRQVLLCALSHILQEGNFRRFNLRFHGAGGSYSSHVLKDLWSALLLSPNLESLKLIFDRKFSDEFFRCFLNLRLINDLNILDSSMRSLVLQTDEGGIRRWPTTDVDEAARVHVITWLDMFGSSKNLEELEFELHEEFPNEAPYFSSKLSAYFDQMEQIESIDVHLNGKADDTVGKALAALVKRSISWKYLFISGIRMSERTVEDLRHYLSGPSNTSGSTVYLTSSTVPMQDDVILYNLSTEPDDMSED